MATNKTPSFNMAEFLAQVTTPGNATEYKRDEDIFKIGDKADRVYYLRSGQVSLTVVSEQGKEAVLGFVLPGQFFGQSCLSGETVRRSFATAMEPVQVIGIKQFIFQSLLNSDQDFASAFLQDLLARNDRIQADLEDQLFNNSERRLARVLLTLAHYGNHREPQPILGKISQTTLADKIGTTRSRVSYFMNKFRKLGFISYNGTIEVNPSLLHAVLHEWPEDDKDTTAD